MKLHHIVTEMAWVDKFAELERHVREQNMTLGQLIDYIGDNFHIFVIPDIDPRTDPMSVGNAGMTPDPVDSEEIPEHLRGRHALILGFGPGISEDTPVEEINEIFPRLRHELSHFQQTRQKSKEQFGDYINPDMSSPFSPQSGMYTIQPVERAPWAVDIAHHLAATGISPNAFEKAIDKAYASIREGEGVTAEDMMREVNKAARELMGVVDDEMLKDIVDKYELSSSINQLGGVIGQMAILRAMAYHSQSKEQKRMIRGRYHQFMKQVRSRYPKAKGYFKTHEKEHRAALERTKEKRGMLQQQLEMMAREFAEMMAAAQEAG